MQDVHLLAAARTPIGSFLGALSSLTAPQLGAIAIRGALAQAQLDAERVEQVIFGNVLQAGLGQAPARQAAIGAGIPVKAGAITVSKVCGSGLRAVMDAANAIATGEWQVVVAGGMESMSNAPHLLERSRAGFRMGEVKMTDSMIKDGLWDPYSERHMGQCAELCASKYGFTREAQDEFAKTSYTRAQSASKEGRFASEIVEVPVPQKKGEAKVVQSDEEPFSAPLDKMGQLRPAFEKTGTITAANASKLNDGAAALLVVGKDALGQLKQKPLARIVAYATTAQEPEWFTTAPVAAVQACLKKAGMSVKDIDLWEINEAFAVVAMAAIKDLGLNPAQVNVRGGAIALGHPIGASGARVLTTLVHALAQEKKRFGCFAICIGGGEAACMIVENTNL